jgi:hypothetical protein
VNQTFSRKLQNRFFECTNEVHLPEHGLQKVRVGITPIFRCGAEFYPWLFRGELNSLGHH